MDSDPFIQQPHAGERPDVAAAREAITKEQWHLSDITNSEVKAAYKAIHPMLLEKDGYLRTCTNDQWDDFFLEVYTGWAKCHTFEEFCDMLHFLHTKYAHP